MLGIILLWHSLSLPYNYFACHACCGCAVWIKPAKGPKKVSPYIHFNGVIFQSVRVCTLQSISVVILTKCFGVGVSCRSLYSFVVYLYVNGSGSITSVGEERASLSAVVYL